MTLIALGLCHDKEDQGAASKTGMTERSIAYVINKACQAKLLDEGFLTLNLDRGNLDQRVDAINALRLTTKVDLAVEVHMNSFQDPTREGFFCMVWHTSLTARNVAKKIAGQLRFMKRKDLGLNQVDRSRRWIDHHWEYENAPSVAWLEDVKCPSIIVEICHLSNEKEAEWIEALDNRILVGEGIAQGIIEYYREADNER
jgi:N-acetylmuramoyl-L-alanine amidase